MIENISSIQKHIILVSIKLSSEIYIIGCDSKENQDEVFEAIKNSGQLPEKYGSDSVATAFKATIEDRYVGKLLINHPLTTNTN